MLPSERMKRGVTEVSSSHLIGYFDCVSFAVFRSGVSLEGLHALDKAHLGVTELVPKACTIVVAEGGLQLPSHAVRVESARLMQLRAGVQLCSCTVIEGGGFVSAATRGVLTAIQLLSFHAYPLHAASTLHEASTWTAKQAGRGQTWATDLAGFIDGSRKAAATG